MKIKFWGVRGSIPVPGPDTVKYGGNTTCIEIRTDDDELIILDGGTGIFQLAQDLLRKMPVTANVFVSHGHWDHIQGFPFFTPMFVTGNRLRFHGAYDPVSERGVEQVLDMQLQYSFFPVREAEMKAEIEYFVLSPGQLVQLGSATVTAVQLNHTTINFGYRIDSRGKSVFFTGDHEPYYNIYDPADEHFLEYRTLIEDKEHAIVDALRGINVLIADASYTVEEYPANRGWGHGTHDSCIHMAKTCGAKILYCTHHEPRRNDEALEHEFAKALTRNRLHGGRPECRLAREGEVIEI